MSDVTNILITGVGGQGILLASRVLAEAALNSGNEVKASEVHGMAQRGGAVITHLRFGEHVYSPFISMGQADFLVSFEKLEAIRCLPFLHKDGLVIVNNQELFPLPVLLGKASYPPESSAFLTKQTDRVCFVPALEKALELGDARGINMILLGCLAKYLHISEEYWTAAIEKCVRPAFVDLNKRAFFEGMNYCC